MNNFSHQESNQVPNSTMSTDSFIRRRRGAVRKQNVHEVKFPKKNFISQKFFFDYWFKNSKDIEESKKKSR